MPGMVGYETFRRFVTRIDYGAKTITLIDPKYFDPKTPARRSRFAFNGNAAIVDGSFQRHSRPNSRSTPARAPR